MLEKELLLKLLDQYADDLGNRGCNDYVLQDTPENRELAERFNAWCAKENPQDPPLLEFDNGKAVGYDWLIAMYLKNWIGSVV